MTDNAHAPLFFMRGRFGSLLGPLSASSCTKYYGTICFSKAFPKALIQAKSIKLFTLISLKVLANAVIISAISDNDEFKFTLSQTRIIVFHQCL